MDSTEKIKNNHENTQVSTNCHLPRKWSISKEDECKAEIDENEVRELAEQSRWILCLLKM